MPAVSSNVISLSASTFCRKTLPDIALLPPALWMSSNSSITPSPVTSSSVHSRRSQRWPGWWFSTSIYLGALIGITGERPWGGRGRRRDKGSQDEGGRVPKAFAHGNLWGWEAPPHGAAPTRLPASCFSAFPGPQTRPSDLTLPGVMRLERKDLFDLFNIKK